MDYESRFWTKVSKLGPAECWPWVGARNDSGYGVLRVAGKNHRATRLSLQLAGQQVPADRDALHSCHNPCCVNPAHLRVGTPTENAEDARAAGRLSQGEAHPISKLKAGQVQEIRALKGQVSQRSLARRYGVSRGAVDNIHRGKNWKGLPQWL